MKTLFLSLFFSVACGLAQATEPPQAHHYVVIGAFAIKKNAERFVMQAARFKLDAHFEINPNRNLYYVYVYLTDNRQDAINQALRLRSSTPYNDTWVFNGLLGNGPTDNTGEDINPLTRQGSEKIVIADVASQVFRGQVQQAAEVHTKQRNEDVPVTSEATNVQGVNAQQAGAENSKQETVPAEPYVPFREVVFSLYRADNRAPVAGDVLVIDMERSRKVGSFEANRVVQLNHPGNQSGEVLMQAEVFGYRKVQKTFQFNKPETTGTETDERGNLVIPFELVRLQKGDIAVMYNVYFFKDAAVMRPESRWEVNSLLEMLKENRGYKIRIHGHTNGNAPGKIISRKGSSDNFFSLTDTREGYGSAKKLSQERAEAIKEFLVANGIEAGRMQIKAWGGKRPVVDKLHTLAENNVRVEIEILEH
ncbi:MAG: hypothetical protein KatS3mg032_1965 [Cyclobacteriaceae bacterium]|nr:MAG: hypothetical protein KatS3mg032_1965 [Cyclobacteriaceae bacterium]